MRICQEAGKNPFQTISLPEAVLTFRQGIGRLLRTAGDKGTIVLLDQRVKTAGYGRLFLEALPTSSLLELTDAELGLMSAKRNKSRINAAFVVWDEELFL